MNFKKPSLVVQIFICMVLGIVIGYIFNNSETAEDAKIIATRFQLLSDLFLRLIKMIIVPLVFSLLVVGIAKAGDFKVVGRLGIKTLVYFTSAALIALVMGLVIVNVFEPGKSESFSTISQLAAPTVKPKPFNAKDFITNIFPENIIDEMSKNHILPIIVFALFFAVAAASLKKKGEIVIEFFDSISHIMLKVANYVMNLAPLAVFGAVGAVITLNGLGILKAYSVLITCFFGGLLFFVFVVLLGICTLFKINFFKLVSHVKEPILLAFSTASSEAAMPKTIEGLERFGCKNKIVSFVLPLGYSFNLDGSIMYMTFATMTLAQVYHVDLTLGQQITMLLMLMVTSKGMAGVPRASLIVIAGMLETFNIPIEALTLLVAVDWLLDMGRSATNVVGNAVATAVISKWEGELGEPNEQVDSLKL